jgi:broad specificity phosphatase PhoE
MLLLLIRHAESQGNFERRLQGQREFPLTERGLAQAHAVAERLVPLPLSAVYSSPVGRAMQTAEVIAAKACLRVIAEPRLQEYDFGEGRIRPHMAGDPRAAAGDRRGVPGGSRDFPAYPGEEGRDSLQQRVRAAMRDIAEGHQGDANIAVVTHARPITLFLLDVIGREYERPLPFVLDNASITTVEENNRAPSPTPRMVVTGINDACHLNQIQSEDRAGGT